MRWCERCGEPLDGRADRRFCSTRCRVAAHRARRRAVTPDRQLAAAQLEAIDVESLMLDDVFRDVDASIASLAESHAATRRT